MTLWQSFILGLIQGLTEFFPISSSGHLVLLQSLMELPSPKSLIFYDVILHIATLLAIFVVFWRRIQEALSEKTVPILLFIGTTPLFFIVPFIPLIKFLFEPPFLAFFFLLTALFLYGVVSIKKMPKERPLTELSKKDAFVIGLFQMLAIIPGISRSGFTICAARFLGKSQKEAVEFSFLLAIPAIIGALFYEGGSVYLTEGVNHASVSLSGYFIGFLSSFVAGVITLKMLVQLAKKDRYEGFILYLLVLSFITFFLFNL